MMPLPFLKVTTEYCDVMCRYLHGQGWLFTCLPGSLRVSYFALVPHVLHALLPLMLLLPFTARRFLHNLKTEGL